MESEFFQSESAQGSKASQESTTLTHRSAYSLVSFMWGIPILGLSVQILHLHLANLRYSNNNESLSARSDDNHEI